MLKFLQNYNEHNKFKKHRIIIIYNTHQGLCTKCFSRLFTKLLYHKLFEIKIYEHFDNNNYFLLFFLFDTLLSK